MHVEQPDPHVSLLQGRRQRRLDGGAESDGRHRDRGRRQPRGQRPLLAWAFGLGGAAANAAAAAINAAQKDENRIKVQQTIPVDGLLDLANGRTWSIRTRVKDGCNLFGCSRDFDWELTVQAWGCADRLPTTK